MLNISCLYARKEVSFNEWHYKFPFVSTSNPEASSLVRTENPCSATIFAEVLIIPPL